MSFISKVARFTAVIGGGSLFSRTAYRVYAQEQTAPSEPSPSASEPDEPKETPEERAMHEARAAEFGYEIPERECPMCEFIRKGPCYREYFAYDKCHKDAVARALPKDEEANACMPLFVGMFDCMKQPQHLPYYEPMVQYFDRIEQEAEAEDTDAAAQQQHSQQQQQQQQEQQQQQHVDEDLLPPRRVWQYQDGQFLAYNEPAPL